MRCKKKRCQSECDNTACTGYFPFGEMLTGKQTGFGFNAEWYDAATGMQNLRARQYEPAMGRFSEKDILRGNMWEPLGLNRYAYVKNDPNNHSDASGRSSEPVSVSNLDALSVRAQELVNDDSIRGLDAQKMKGAAEVFVNNAIAAPGVMDNQAALERKDGISLAAFEENFQKKTGASEPDARALSYTDALTNEDRQMVDRLNTIRSGYANNCAVSANGAAAAAGVANMPDYYSSNFLTGSNDDSRKAMITKIWDTNEGEALHRAGVIARMFEQDPSFIGKVEVKNEEELATFFASALPEYVTVCAMNWDGITTTKNIGDAVYSTYDHIVVNKTWFLAKATGYSFGTFVGATRYYNDMPYEFLFYSHPNVRLTFYLNKIQK